MPQSIGKFSGVFPDLLTITEEIIPEIPPDYIALYITSLGALQPSILDKDGLFVSDLQVSNTIGANLINSNNLVRRQIAITNPSAGNYEFFAHLGPRLYALQIGVAAAFNFITWPLQGNAPQLLSCDGFCHWLEMTQAGSIITVKIIRTDYVLANRFTYFSATIDTTINPFNNSLDQLSMGKVGDSIIGYFKDNANHYAIIDDQVGITHLAGAYADISQYGLIPSASENKGYGITNINHYLSKSDDGEVEITLTNHWPTTFPSFSGARSFISTPSDFSQICIHKGFFTNELIHDLAEGTFGANPRVNIIPANHPTIGIPPWIVFVRNKQIFT